MLDFIGDDRLATNDDGKTPLQVAEQAGNATIAMLLRWPTAAHSGYTHDE